MAIINTNMKALFSRVALNSNERKSSIAMQQLSTGKRINSARDDAAGMAISTRMTQQIRGLNMAVRNAGDAISLIQTAEGATNEITDMMQRMRELAVQAVNDTNDNAQRSYLDLEFQQLKQQIVQIADNTEWNGFSLLNGKAGEQVGEMPMFKATSQNKYDPGFINPTTTRTIEGPDAGEIQTITLGGATPIGQNITIGDVTYNIGANENTSALLATKMKFLLLASTSFGPNSGRIVTDNGAGVITIKYAGTEGDVPDTNIVAPTGLTAAVASVPGGGNTVPRVALAKSDEKFNGNGKYLQSGAMSVHITTTGEIQTTFITNDNKTISMTGIYDDTNKVINYTSTTGANGSVISDNLALKLQDSAGVAQSLIAVVAGGGNPAVYRDATLKIAVAGTIPVMQSGDLWVNGINVGGSYAIDDKLSPITNAAGSAIAKAAAINRKALDLSANQGESQSVTFTGNPIPNTTIIVGGVSVLITSNESTATLAAAKIATTLRSSFEYGPNSGRVITYAPGGTTVNIDFPTSEGNVEQTVVKSGSSNLNAIVDTTQSFSAVQPGTGVFAKVNENIFTGKAQTGTSAVTGTIIINGFASGNVTSTINNPQQTRADVVRAINMITSKTGVKAIDSGATNNGIILSAADGRNIEVRFETNSNSITFGDRIGMREGVQSSTISLESKIPAPIILTSTTGNIANSGLVEGNFSKNQSVYTTQVRPPVDFAKPQMTSVLIGSQAMAAADKVNVTINGTSITQASVSGTTGILSSLAVRDEMVGLINAQTSITGVAASAGRQTGELFLTAVTPGINFTATASTTSATNLVTSTPEVANSKPPMKDLGANDLLINGYAIRATTTADDDLTSTVTSSSGSAASAIALAKAINASSPETGVKALANPAISIGTTTDTQLPASGPQTIFINGTKVDINFVQNEPLADRRLKVINAINDRTGQHGVTASDNGRGVTLSSDGRNASVWFDSNIQDLKPSSFGLEKSGAVAQVSQVKVGGAIGATTTASFVINGTTVTVPAAAGNTTAAIFATSLKNAIVAAGLRNITAVIDTNDATNTTVKISSTIPGSPFDIRGASVGVTAGTINISEITANSLGNNDITGIRNATASSTEARTIYGTVKLINITDSLPDLQSPADLLPSPRKSNPKPFSVTTGSAGFTDRSNFAAIGFQQGNFGGRSSQDMNAPRVGRLAFQVGSSAKQTVTIDFADFGKGGELTGDITNDVDKPVEERRIRINTRDGATAVLNILDTAMDRVNATRATMGAVMNRLDHVINNLSNVSMNMSASRSQVEDADYAQASTELAKSQIMQQAATAVLAQANTSQQSVLKLLQG